MQVNLGKVAASIGLSTDCSTVAYEGRREEQFFCEVEMERALVRSTAWFSDFIGEYNERGNPKSNAITHWR